jgi:APA family basic amino acid/polyamine antiporter
MFAIGYGDVGSSIYYALGVTTAFALGAAPVAIAIAGIFFVFTVLTYAELSASIPESGGAQIFARRAFGDVASFIAGWALLLDYIITAAISAYTVAPYLGYFWPILKTTPGHLGFTALLLVSLGLINILGIRESTRLSLILAILGIVTQGVIVVLGFVLAFDLTHLVSQIQWGTAPTWRNFIYGISIAMVAYTGIEAVSQMSEEATDPGRKVPRAMLATMATVLTMYLGISLVALSIISPTELGTQWVNDPMAGIVHYLPVIGSYVAPWIAVLGAVILTIAANAGVIGASRLAYAMANNYQIPRFFNRLHPTLKTPYLALSVFTGVAILVVLAAKNLKVLADLYNFGAMLAFSMAHLSLIGLRIKEPDLERPFKLKPNIKLAGRAIPITAILGFSATFTVWLIVVFTHIHGRNLGFLWLGLGVILYAWYRRKAQLPVMETVEIEQVEVPEYRPIVIKTLLVPITAAHLDKPLQWACHLAREQNAHITVLHVIEVPSSLPLDTFLPDKLAAADAIVKQAMAIGRDYNLQIATQVVQARSAGQVIVEVAKEKGFDAIVLGTAYRQGAAAWLGSTAEYVLRNAPCHVLICKIANR